MKVPQQAVDIIKEFEGFEPRTYDDGVGVLTIGYGTTARAGVGIVPIPGMTITRKEAEKYLRRGIEKFAKEIEPAISAPINENEWSAFLSLAYNIGPSAFKRSSALRRFNAGDKRGAADAILMWNKGGGKIMRGLVRRRQAEKELFERPAKPARVQNPLVSAIMWLAELIGRLWK